MAYLGPRNKIKIKSSKPNEFIYYDDGTPFNGSYLQTSKGEYYEGDNVNNPGRSLILSQSNRRKINLLALLKTLLAIAASIALILQVLEELKKLAIDLAEIAEFQNMIDELLTIPEGGSLSEQNLSNLNNSLNKFPTEDFPVSNNIVVHEGTYNNIKSNIYNKLNNNQSPISTKIKPNDQDYSNGSYIRYFAKKVNSANYYIEVDKFTHDKIIKKTDFDHNLYIVSSLRWDLSSNAKSKNDETLNNLKVPFPNIKSLFDNSIEYAQIGNSNLYAEEGELYYIDGTPYIGEYHVHPIKGPMVGAKHTAEPHDYLYYSYEVGNPIIPTNEVLKEEDITGLVTTSVFSGMVYKFYIRKNKFGIYIEVMDETEAKDGIINTVYTSDFKNPSSTNKDELIVLAKKELGILPISVNSVDNPKPGSQPEVSYINPNTPQNNNRTPSGGGGSSR